MSISSSFPRELKHLSASDRRTSGADESASASPAATQGTTPPAVQEHKVSTEPAVAFQGADSYAEATGQPPEAQRQRAGASTKRGKEELFGPKAGGQGRFDGAQSSATSTAAPAVHSPESKDQSTWVLPEDPPVKQLKDLPELLSQIKNPEEDLPKLPEPVSAVKVESPAPAANTVVRKTQPHIDPDPIKFGMGPKDPKAHIRPGEHALNMMPKSGSQYVSSSASKGGAPGIQGKPYWLDIDKTKAAGSEYLPPETVAQDVSKLVQEGRATPAQGAKWSRAQELGEREALFKGPIPPEAIETRAMRMLKRAGRVVKLLGVGVTVYDVGRAAKQSVEQDSLKPLAAEGVRQLGGWGGATLGYLGAGAAAKALGLAGMAALGPAIAGGAVLGVAAYVGFDLLADQIHKN